MSLCDMLLQEASSQTQLTKKVAIVLLLFFILFDWKIFCLALHWGIVSSNTNIIRTLLEAGASLDCVNANGQTPLDLALERKNNYIIHVLKEERFHRGVGRPGFVNSLLGDPVSLHILQQVKTWSR